MVVYTIKTYSDVLMFRLHLLRAAYICTKQMSLSAV